MDKMALLTISVSTSGMTVHHEEQNSGLTVHHAKQQSGLSKENGGPGQIEYALSGTAKEIVRLKSKEKESRPEGGIRLRLQMDKAS
ncbi:MAG: hypothetical protein ACI4CA_01055 [Bacteroides sp.]